MRGCAHPHTIQCVYNGVIASGFDVVVIVFCVASALNLLPVVICWECCQFCKAFVIGILMQLFGYELLMDKLLLAIYIEIIY